MKAFSAVSLRGIDSWDLGKALRWDEKVFTPCAALGGILASQVPELPAELDVEPRQRKLMSRGARLSCVAARELFREQYPPLLREETGFFLGVGASGGAVEELEAMLGASFSEEAFDLGRFGTAGLSACNPLFAFQLMNNYTLCHAAIREGLKGPNAAIFSRGAGTVLALAEAHHAVSSGECDFAIAGGADSALHPVTWAELRRGGEDVSVPGEGAALLMLEPHGGTRPLAVIERCEVHSGRREFALALESAKRSLLEGPRPELVVLAATPKRSGAARELISSVCSAPVFETAGFFGEALAASASLATVAAIGLMRDMSIRSVCVLVMGPDGDVGIVRLCQ